MAETKKPLLAEKRQAKLEMDLLKLKIERLEKENRSQHDELVLLKNKHGRLAKTRERQELFKPKYTEGRASIEALLKGTGTEQEFTVEQEAKLIELAAMLTDERLLAMYPSWRMRAIALGVTQNMIFSWKNSQRFQQILVEVLANDARIATAMAMPLQAEIASSRLDRNNTKAFGLLARMGGVQSKKADKGPVITKVSIETLILSMVGKASGVQIEPSGAEVKIIDSDSTPKRIPQGSVDHFARARKRGKAVRKVGSK